MSSLSLASRRGHFSTLDELTKCIRASMLVPGLAGPLLTVPINPPPSAPKEPETRTHKPWGGRRKDMRGDEESRGDSFPRPSTSWALGSWWTRRRSKARNSAAERDGRGGESGGLASESAESGDCAAAATGTVSAETELLVDAMVFEPLPYR